MRISKFGIAAAITFLSGAAVTLAQQKGWPVEWFPDWGVAALFIASAWLCLAWLGLHCKEQVRSHRRTAMTIFVVVGMVLGGACGWLLWWSIHRQIIGRAGVSSLNANVLGYLTYHMTLGGQQPPKTFVFMGLSLKNSGQQFLSADTFRLALEVESDFEQDIRPEVLRKGESINTGMGILATFEDRLLPEKAIEGIKPGDTICGWLVFTPHTVTWERMSNKDVKATVSFRDVAERLGSVTATLKPSNDLPSNPCLDDVFNKDLFDRIRLLHGYPLSTNDRQWILKNLADNLNREALLKQYPLGYAVFDVDHQSTVFPYTSLSILEKYDFDWSVVRFTHTGNQITIRLPDVRRKNGSPFIANGSTGGALRVGPFGCVQASDNKGKGLMLCADLLAIRKTGAVFLVGIRPPLAPPPLT